MLTGVGVGVGVTNRHVKTVTKVLDLGPKYFVVCRK
jgi:hypothetical protein